MLQFENLNYGAIIVAAVVYMAVGAFWYSPGGFGKLWTKLTGINMTKNSKDGANKAMAMVALGAIVQSFALAVLIKSLSSQTISHGLLIGLLVWAGFTAATTVGDTVFAKRGWKLWWLNSSYYLIVMLINACILSLWR